MIKPQQQTQSLTSKAKYQILAEKIRAKLEFFKQALRGSTRPTAMPFSSLWILHILSALLETPLSTALANSGHTG